MYYVYIAKSETCYYVGSAENVKRRLKEHNAGKTKSLKNKGPFKLVYAKQFILKTEAIKEERRIKSFKGGNAFKKLIQSASPSSSLA